MKQINKYGFLNALISIINMYDEDDSKVIIARYFLRNFDRLDQLNIYEAADECFVTRASIRRFSKNVGFDNFRDLKSDPDNYNYYHTLSNVINYPEFLSDQITKMANDCNLCLKKELNSILSYIQDCNQIVFLVSDIYSSRCIEFQKGMILAGKMVRIISHKFTDNKLLKNLDRDDLLITVSVTGGFANQINDFISEFSCKKVLITTMHNQSCNENYNLILHLGSNDLPQVKTIYHMFAVEYCLDIIYNEYHNNIK